MYKILWLALFVLTVGCLNWFGSPIIATAQAETFMYVPKVDGAPTRRVGGGTRGGLEMFTPKVDGAPARRVGGGTRGLADSDVLPVVAAIAPESTGFTVSEQPTLYWYLSEYWQVPFRFSLTYDDSEIGTNVSLEDSIDPVLDVEIKQPMSGIQAFDLADYDVALKPEITYRWAIFMVAEEARSNDLVTEATIKFSPADEELTSALNNASEQDKPQIYATQGIWYEAVDTLSELINQNPYELKFSQARSELLRQVGLEFEE